MDEFESSNDENMEQSIKKNNELPINDYINKDEIINDKENIDNLKDIDNELDLVENSIPNLSNEAVASSSFDYDDEDEDDCEDKDYVVKVFNNNDKFDSPRKSQRIRKSIVKFSDEITKSSTKSLSSTRPKSKSNF